MTQNNGKKGTLAIVLVLIVVAGLLVFFYKEKLADYLNKSTVDRYTQPVEQTVTPGQLQVEEKDVIDLEPFLKSKFRVLKTQLPEKYIQDPSTIPADMGSATSVKLFKEKLLFDTLESL